MMFQVVLRRSGPSFDPAPPHAAFMDALVADGFIVLALSAPSAEPG